MTNLLQDQEESIHRSKTVKNLTTDEHKEFSQGGELVDEFDTSKVESKNPRGKKGMYVDSNVFDSVVKNGDVNKSPKSSFGSGKEKQRAEQGDSGSKRSVAVGKRKQDRLNLQLSQSLTKKLAAKAQLEGVSIEDFATELIAEGLVLRAWEIMERKSAMRGNHPPANNGGQSRQGRYGFRSGGSQGSGRNRSQNGHSSNYSHGHNQTQNGNSGYSGNSNGNGNQSHGRRSNYKNIMDDNASFLEYVRSQEKKQR